MSIDVSLVDDRAVWNELVEQSSQSVPFHRFEALEIMAKHSGSELLPYCGHKGEQPVGLFPLFSLSRGPVRIAVSPPPDLKINYLGPVLLNHKTLKQRKAEKRHTRFIDAVDDHLQRTVDPHYVHVRTGPDYGDPRPFDWNGFTLRPEYTYEVDITEPIDDLFMSFSGDIRSNVRQATNTDHELFEGDWDDAERILAMVRDRHAEQDVAFDVPTSFVRDLYEALPDGTVRVYGCRSGGQFLGGDLTLENDELLLAWQGAADYDHELAVTDLVLWNVIQQARDRGLTRYDLCGANNRRLCQYKSKFDPTVRTYYTIERGTKAINRLKNLYTRFR